MKKLFFFAAVALTFAACTKTTIDESAAPDVPVTFQAANYTPATKAGGEVSVFGDFKNFQCLAYLHAVGVDLNADGTQKEPASCQNFFGTAGETISPYDNTNTVIANPTKETNNVSYWAPSHNYYWPKDSKSYVNFVAWYGTDGTNAVNPSVNYTYDTKWKATMTWNFSSTVGSAGANLLYADMAWRYNQTPAAQYGLNGLSTGTNKGVPMLFHHALAQINVKAYALAAEATPANPTINAGVTDGTATWTILLKDVKITPVIKDGTLALTNEDPGTNETRAWSGTWAARSGSAAGDMVRNGDYTVDKVTKDTAGDLIAATCVVPQTIGADVVLSFNLDITTTYNDGVSHREIIPISIKLNDMNTTAWAMNTKYTYYLQINPSQKTVLFDPAVEADWVEGTTTEKII